jgi:hypothetical protein
VNHPGRAGAAIKASWVPLSDNHVRALTAVAVNQLGLDGPPKDL